MSSPSAERCLVLEDGVRVPFGARTLESFRRWARSPSFPEAGRIDFLQGDVEVDMSPEDLGTHGSPKAAIGAALFEHVRLGDLGMVWIDRARLSNRKADLSCEPDVVFFRWETLESGRARLIRRASRAPGRYIEVEGTADLVVEVVSDSSEAKDTRRLRRLYHLAGVSEYWLVDARGPKPGFAVLLRRTHGYAAAPVNRAGFTVSRVLKRKVRLVSSASRMGLSRYELVLRPRR
ncbi:MAG: Uma2 family endonuclease [Planctomycetes bacterium]|nr:Uma2 family endonuclease [Planctomycetota bacterium]